MRETLTESTKRNEAMADLAHHVSLNLPAGIAAAPDVKTPAKVAVKVKAQELGESDATQAHVCHYLGCL
jgi:hypothetical protein